MVSCGPAPGGMDVAVLAGDEAGALACVRGMLDLDADAGRDRRACSAAIRSLGSAPGVRVPGTVDGGELAVRAVLGQQISLRAASTHAARIVQAVGEPLAHPVGAVTHVFPTLGRDRRRARRRDGAAGAPQGHAARAGRRHARTS